MRKIEDIDHISFSSLDLYEQCPFAWMKTYLEGMRSPGNHYSEFGSCIHTVLEEWGKARIKGIEFNLEHLLTIYELNFPIDAFDNAKHRQDYKLEGKLMLERFYQHEGHIVPLMIEKELNLIIPGIPKIELHIDRIDGLEDQPESWSLQDYKSGKAFPQKKVDEHLQASIYMLAIKQNYGALPKEFLYKFLKHPLKKTGYKISQALRSADQLNHAEERVQRFWQNVNDNKFDPTPPSEYFCDNFCFFKKVGECNCKKKLVSGWEF